MRRDDTCIPRGVGLFVSLAWPLYARDEGVMRGGDGDVMKGRCRFQVRDGKKSSQGDGWQIGRAHV